MSIEIEDAIARTLASRKGLHWRDLHIHLRTGRGASWTPEQVRNALRRLQRRGVVAHTSELGWSHQHPLHW